MTPTYARSVPGVLEATWRRGSATRDGAPPNVVVEVPHGATRAAHFDALFARLVGGIPGDLRDFFFVNTDVGAPEVALAFAERLATERAAASVLVLRCLVPRTFVDCNRVIDRDAKPASSAAGAVTPGLMPWATDAKDRELLLSLYFAYREAVEGAVEAALGAGGRALMLHSYAPRSVDVPVDERIVERLKEAYSPGVVDRWPLRPEVDFIHRDPAGRSLCDEALAKAVEAAFRESGVGVAWGRAYDLHPATLAGAIAARHPGRTLCLEMRRDLLVRAWTPFAEMDVDPARAGAMATALARGCSSLFPAG